MFHDIQRVSSAYRGSTRHLTCLMALLFAVALLVAPVRAAAEEEEGFEVILQRLEKASVEAAATSNSPALAAAGLERWNMLSEQVRSLDTGLSNVVTMAQSTIKRMGGDEELEQTVALYEGMRTDLKAPLAQLDEQLIRIREDDRVKALLPTSDSTNETNSSGDSPQ